MYFGYNSVMHFDLVHFLPTIGLLGITAIVFAESGLLIGFFLPGDSLLFTAGFLASQGIFDIKLLTFLCFLAAVAGDSVGYTFGHKVGRRLFQKKESMLFHPDHLERAKRFYEKHGKKTIILARFVPVVRTFAPVVAGIGDMEYRTFLTYNVIGGFLWAVLIPLGGYFFGRLLPADKVDALLLPIIALIVFVSIAPQTYHILKDPVSRKQIVLLLNKALSKLR